MFELEHPYWNFFIFAGNSFFDTSLNLIMIVFFFRLIFIGVKIATSQGTIERLNKYKTESKFLIFGLFLQIVLKVLMNVVFEERFEL